MAHQRPRLCHPDLLRLLRFSPIVGVFGHRQVGKTTLVSTLSDRTYRSLDRAETLRNLIDSPVEFLDALPKGPLTLDEAQLAPQLFPELKERVRISSKPGQYLLTGSVRFTSRKAIRESLTGRILTLEVLPLSIPELYGESVNEQFWKKPKSFLREYHPVRQDLAQRWIEYSLTGGLPGICFIRDRSLMMQKHEDQMQTILDRDLRLLTNTRLPQATLLRILIFLATRPGLPFELSELSRFSRVSVPTLRSLLVYFEALYLIRRVRTIGGRRTDVFFLEDAGEASRLALRDESRMLSDEQRVLMSLFSNLRVILPQAFRGETFEATSYRTRGGAEIPLVFLGQKRKFGFIPLRDDSIPPAALGSAKSLIARYPGTKVMLVHPGKNARTISDEIFLVPLGIL